MRNLPIDFHSGCTGLYCNHKSRRFCLFFNATPQCSLLDVLMIDILCGIRWNLSIDLFYISLIQLLNIFSYFLAACTTSLKCVFTSIAHFLITSFNLGGLIFGGLHILSISRYLSAIWHFHFIFCSFHFSLKMASFVVEIFIFLLTWAFSPLSVIT